MDQPRHYTMLAGYNRWANRLLYGAVANLPEDAWTRETGAYFGSMCGTLNHILVGDRIWMRRFTNEGETHSNLNDCPYPGFGELQSARTAMDDRIVAWIGNLDPNALAAMFTYTPASTPEPVTQQLAPALAHFFNHQTHHRGQAHMILSALGHEPPQLDLIYFQRSGEFR